MDRFKDALKKLDPQASITLEGIRICGVTSHLEHVLLAIDPALPSTRGWETRIIKSKADTESNPDCKASSGSSGSGSAGKLCDHTAKFSTQMYMYPFLVEVKGVTLSALPKKLTIPAEAEQLKSTIISQYPGSEIDFATGKINIKALADLGPQSLTLAIDPKMTDTWARQTIRFQQKCK